MSRMRENQVSVPLDARTRQYLEEAAAREHRTLTGQVRHLVAEAARNSQIQEGTT